MKKLIFIILCALSLQVFGQQKHTVNYVEADSIRSRISGASSKLNIVHRVDDRELFFNDTTAYDWISAHGGGGTPGGSDTQLQYRVNSTTFGGISGATSSGTNVTFSSGALRATAPRFTTSLLDANGNIHFGLTATTSAVNYLQYANAATGSAPIFTATGTDSDIDIVLSTKGTNGSILVNSSSKRTDWPISGSSNHAKMQTVSNSSVPFAAIRGIASALGPNIILGKSRTSGGTGNGVVQSGDELGILRFTGTDGAKLVTGAYISGAVDGTPGTDDMPGRIGFFTTADGAASASERARITNGGSLYVGTTTGVTGGGAVQVNGSVNVSGDFKINGVAIGIGNVLGSGTAGYIPLWSGSETIGNSSIYDTGGDLGLGTTTISYAAANRKVLEINGTSESMVAYKVGGSQIGHMFANSGGLTIYGESGKNVAIATNAANRLIVGTTGQLTLSNYTSSSSFTGTTAGYLAFNTSGQVLTKSTANVFSDLSLASMAQQSASSVAITGGSITGITDLTVADGGTGSSTLTGGQLLIGNGTSPIFQTASLVWDNVNTRLGMGATSPASTAHVSESTSSTGATAGLTIENTSTGDAVTHYKVAAQTFSVGVDNSASDAFTVTPSTTLGSTSSFRLYPSGRFSIGENDVLNTGKLYIRGAADNILINAEASSGSGEFQVSDDGETYSQGGYDIIYRTSGGSESVIYEISKTINIGDWNMDATASVNVSHGLGSNFLNIREVSVMIYRDDVTAFLPLTSAATGGTANGYWSTDNTNIVLNRIVSGVFDSTNYDSTSFNRGYVTIRYTTTCTATVCP